MAASRQAGRTALAAPLGGVNTRVHATKIPDDNYVMLKNLEMAQDLGIWKSRNGTTFYASNGIDPGVIDANPIRGGYRFYYGASSKKLLVASGTRVMEGSDVLGTFTNIKTGLTADRDYYFGASRDYCFYVNGADAPQRYDGTNNRAAGFPAPGSACTAAAGAATGLTGAYQYKITFLYDSNDAHESSASAVSNTLTVTDQKIDLSAIPTGGTGCTGRNVFRTKAGGSEFFFRSKIANNTDTTLTGDNMADSALGTNQAPTDNGLPPSGAQFIVFLRDRMILAKTSAQPQRVYLSAIVSTEKSPGGGETVHGAGREIFPASHFLDVGDNNSPITGLAIVRDMLVVFKEDGIYTVIGDDAQDMAVTAVESTAGCIAPRTIVGINGALFFLGRTNGVPEVYRFDGASAEAVSTPIEPTLKANVVGLTDLTLYPIQPCATVYRGQYILCYPLVATEPITFETAILDLRPPSPRWGFADKIEASVFIPWYGRGDSGQLYYGSQQTGRILRFDTGSTDFAVPTTNIATTIETKWLDLGKPAQLKNLHRIEVLGKANASTTLTIERIYDLATTGTTTGASAVAMTASITGHSVFKKVFDCEQSDGATPEFGYFVKLKITTSGVLDITDIILEFTVEPPGTRHDAA